MAGEPVDASAEVFSALPSIEQHNLTREAIAAIGILRAAIRRQQTDPDALRQLREQLQLMHREGKL